MVVTGEASGDLHGANLIRAMRDLDPGLRFCGMGGREMAQAGTEILFPAEKVAVVGIAEVVSRLPDIFTAQRVLRRRLRDRPPSLLVIIDLPDFNLLLARYAKRLGIPVFYYICPQVWAWRKGRAKTIARLVDGAGVILPFEEPFLRQHGVAASYVGHPLLDTLEPATDAGTFRSRHQIAPTTRCIGLLPGSRRREIGALLPQFLEAAVLLTRQARQPLTFLLPVASTVSSEFIRQNGVDEYREQLDIRLVTEDRYGLMRACDGALAASGTVTLELALHDVPMVVAYRVSPMTYRIGRLLIHLESFSLVNLIAGTKVVPELLQDEVTPQHLAEALQEVLPGGSKRSEMLQGLEAVRTKLGEQGASRRAANLAMTLLPRTHEAR